ncbi:MAG: response regulator [Nitrospirae bacterium]|nr:response regulator [Nitrospirota bacterium]
MPLKLILEGKRCLLVDDFSEFRYSVKKMLQSLGASDVDDTGDGDEAIDKIALKSYDLILCDYNLGENKRDGQQILEEAKHKEILKYSAIFIMITAENTMRMVMGAMEYKPDDYLTKPFTKEALLARLEKIMEKKNDFATIDKALARKDYHSALKMCNDKIQSKPKNLYELLKLKAELSITVGDYPEAESIYNQIVNIRRLPWALLGLGKALFLSTKHMEAKEIFLEIIDENRSFVEAYDWLAKVLEALGDSKEAQRMLMRALELSPKAILRQKALADLAYKNNDLATAENSYKQAVDLGKNSCFKSAKDYTGLAQVMLDKKTPEKALKVLQDSKTIFTNDRESTLQATLMQGLAHKELGNEADLKSSIEEANSLFSGMKGTVNSVASLDIAGSFFKLGEADKANQIMQDVIRNNHDNEKVLKKAQEVFTSADMQTEGERMIAATKREIIKVNNDGVMLVKNGKLAEAIDFFSKAASGLPENKIINANAAQAMLMYMQKFGKTDKHVNQVQRYLDQIRKVDPTYKKYQELVAVYKKLTEA